MIKTYIREDNNLILYHGSNNKFEKFNKKFLGSSMGKAPSNMRGFYFTNNIKLAKSFGKYIYKVKVKINNPYIFNANGKGYSQLKHTINNIVDEIDNQYDSILIRNYQDAGIGISDLILSDQYIIFDLRNIKILEIL
jgi:hypothetical protein